MADSLDIETLEALPELRYCRDSPDTGLRGRFMEVIEDIGVSNVFNPSFYASSTLNIFAFRAIPDGSGELVSFVSVEDKSGRTLSRISPELFQGMDARRLIDPKVFTVGEAVYLTFNSGWIPSGRNDIFVMQVYPTLGEPKKVIYEARRDLERNWAFFSERGEVYAIYQIAPLVILKLEKVSANSWSLVDHYRSGDENLPHDLSLGTQPFKHGGRYYLHRK